MSKTLPRLAVTRIASQFYCEKKLELELIFGRKPNLKMRLGTQGHSYQIKDKESIPRKKLLEIINQGEKIDAFEFFLSSDYHNFRISGRTDGVKFHNRIPLFLWDYKFSGNDKIEKHHTVQTALYCYLLQNHEFDTSKLKYAVIKLPFATRNSSEIINIHNSIFEKLEKDIILIKTSSGNIKTYVYSFDEKSIIKDLDWALQYWNKEREAIPTTDSKKCTNCRFNGKDPSEYTCEFSQVI